MEKKHSTDPELPLHVFDSLVASHDILELVEIVCRLLVPSPEAFILFDSVAEIAILVVIVGLVRRVRVVGAPVTRMRFFHSAYKIRWQYWNGRKPTSSERLLRNQVKNW